MLLHGVQLWVSSPKSLIKATNAAAVCTLRLLRCAETAGCNDDNDIRRLKRKMKRVWTRSTALCPTVAPCSTKPSTTDGANTKHMHPHHQRNWMSRPITRVLVSTWKLSWRVGYYFHNLSPCHSARVAFTKHLRCGKSTRQHCLATVRHFPRIMWRFQKSILCSISVEAPRKCRV